MKTEPLTLASTGFAGTDSPVVVDGVRLNEFFAWTPMVCMGQNYVPFRKGNSQITHLPSGFGALMFVHSLSAKWKAQMMCDRLMSLPIDWTMTGPELMRQIKALDHKHIKMLQAPMVRK